MSAIANNLVKTQLDSLKAYYTCLFLMCIEDGVEKPGAREQAKERAKIVLMHVFTQILEIDDEEKFNKLLNEGVPP